MGKQGVIVLVDDDPVILETLELELGSEFEADFILETASGAREALEIIEEHEDGDGNVFLIISDWLMPGIKGDEFLIDVYKRWPYIKALLLTGQANEDAVKNAKDKSNMLFCVRKPWNKDNLIELIKEMLPKLDSL